MISTSTSPALGPSSSTSWISSGRFGATAIAALVFMRSPSRCKARVAATFAARKGGCRVATKRPKMPRTVWALGFVSLFMDLSSETIHALLPLFLTTTLGASVATVGAIDGIPESTASISKIFSGWLSDKIGRRKPLILLGYGLAALSKPLFPVASSAFMVLGARFADRIGKGLRGAPRDALVADVTPDGMRGRAFGLRQAMDTIGGFAGPLAAIALMLMLQDDMRTIFWLALIPAFLS